MKAKVQSNIEHLNLIKELLYQLFVQLVELEEGRGDWDRSWEERESYHQVKIWKSNSFELEFSAIDNRFSSLFFIAGWG